MKLYFIFVFLFFNQALHAYTDPGTGAMIWQLLMAGGIGLLFYARTFITWIKSFGKKKVESTENNSQE